MFCASISARIGTVIVGSLINWMGSPVLILGPIIYELYHTTRDITYVARGTLLAARVKALRFGPLLIVVERRLAENLTISVSRSSTSRISSIIVWGRQAWLLLVVIICDLNFVFIKEVSREFKCSLQDISDL